METVITRIFYEANRRHGKISLADLRKSGFEKTLRKLENSDLNQTEDCFSYKHFYVIYCKFWELDQDHDLILDEKDLSGYGGGAISTRIIRRVMQGYGNETGMFIVPDQEMLFMQQQQQILLQQQQLQAAQGQLQQTRDQSMEQAQGDTGAVSVNMDIDQELATAIEAIVRDATSDGSDPRGQIESDSPSDDRTPCLTPECTTARIENSLTIPSGSPSMARSTPPGPGSSCRPQNYRMTYKGFIWFLLAETDKQTVTSIEYWFRCMDLDGDGILTVFELEQLFQEQAARMSILGMESFGFRDAICQMQDLVSPRDCGWVRLTDLKQCGQAGPFVDLFCNVVRWRAFEAHQHQIRMRQQQIAMQRAADAAWEEVASGEEMFEDDDEEEDDGEDGDDDGDDEDDEDDEDYDDDEEEGFEDDFDEDEEVEISTGQLLRQKDLLLRNAKASASTIDVSMVESERDGSVQDSKSATRSSSSSALDQEANCIGLGVELVQHVELENNGRENHQGGRRISKTSIVEDGGSPNQFHGEMTPLDQASGGQVMPNKTRRTRTKEKRRRQKSLMRRALLEEQRKEKALLATIR